MLKHYRQIIEDSEYKNLETDRIQNADKTRLIQTALEKSSVVVEEGYGMSKEKSTLKGWQFFKMALIIVQYQSPPIKIRKDNRSITNVDCRCHL